MSCHKRTIISESESVVLYWTIIFNNIYVPNIFIHFYNCYYYMVLSSSFTVIRLSTYLGHTLPLHYFVVLFCIMRYMFRVGLIYIFPEQ